jgi:hypothetical protein
MQINKAAWDRGFSDGEHFIEKMPYEKGTAEADSWRQGWVEGTLKALLLPFYKTPEMRDIFLDANPRTSDAEWRRLLLEKISKHSAK